MGALEKEEPAISSMVCTKLHEKEPSIPVEDCQAVIDGAWKKLQAMCPQKALQGSPVQEVCKELESLEPEISSEVCQKMHDAHTWIPVDECKYAVDFVLKKVEEEVCPATPVQSQDIPKEIEKLICEALE